MKERLSDFLRHIKISQRQFEINCNLSNGFVDKVGDSIRINNLNKISAKYPELNINWLKTGVGEMLKMEINHNYSDKSTPFRLVPLVNYDFVGGIHRGSDAAQVEEYIIGVVPFNDALETDICIPVTGDSMAPTCPAGSIVLVREVYGWREYFGYGNIFCLLLNDGRRILKEVNKCDTNHKEYVLCVSHNNMVPPEELPKKMIERVWKVIKILTDKGW